MRFHIVSVLATLLLMGSVPSEAVEIKLARAATNPTHPQMGDHLGFHTIIRNDTATTISGLIAWISLVQVDKGKEQPVDLEDWSAHKAIPASDLAPGQTLEIDWPIRLIQAGNYQVVVSAASRSGNVLSSSPIAEFTVRQKPVVETRRVLLVAIGMPLLLTGLALRRHFKGRAGTSRPEPARRRSSYSARHAQLPRS